MKTLVVLPTYNESATIAEMLRRIRASARRDGSIDVLVVDDNSPDGTADLAEALAAELGGIEVLRRPGKAGLGSAYREGFKVGLAQGYEALVEMDADLSHDPSVLGDLLAELDGGADIVIGTRYMPGGRIPDWPWHRRAISRAGNLYARSMLDLSARDATSGYRAYHRRALERINLTAVRADGYGFQVEMAYKVERAGGLLAEVPIEFHDRTLRPVEDVVPDRRRGARPRHLVGPVRPPPGPAEAAGARPGLSGRGVPARRRPAHHPPRRPRRLLRLRRGPRGPGAWPGSRSSSAAPGPAGWWPPRPTRPASSAFTRRCRWAGPAASARRRSSSRPASSCTAPRAGPSTRSSPPFTPIIEPIALDEAFLDVTGAVRLLGSGPEIGAAIRARVRAETGLTASVGVASNKLLAKLASDDAKPDGMLVVEPGTELAFLHPHPVRRLWGVGPATLARLERFGVETIGDLARLPEASLVDALGRAHGAHLHALAQGRDDRPVEADRETKSIGQEETFPRDVADREALRREILRMAERVGSRLREHGLAGRTVTIKVRFPDFRTITRSDHRARAVLRLRRDRPPGPRPAGQGRHRRRDPPARRDDEQPGRRDRPAGVALRRRWRSRRAVPRPPPRGSSRPSTPSGPASGPTPSVRPL